MPKRSVCRWAWTRLRRRITRRLFDADNGLDPLEHGTRSSSAFSIQSASACRTSTSTSAWTGATRSSPTSRRSTERTASGKCHVCGVEVQERRQGRGALPRHHADGSPANRQPNSAQDSRRDLHDCGGARRRAETRRRVTNGAAHPRAPRSARKLEGLTRHAGKHAAGMVISEGPLWDHVPVFRDEKSGALVTQYYKEDVEHAGLVKFDFLGLKTLTVLDIAVRFVNARPRPDVAGRRHAGIRRREARSTNLPMEDRPPSSSRLR